MIIDIESSRTKTRSSMSRQVLVPSGLPSPSSSSLNRRRMLFGNSSLESSYCSGRLAELAGGTTAECAAICCCCPCGLADILILTIYKVPAGLCRRALRKKRRQQMIKKGLLPPWGCDDTELQIHSAAGFSPSSTELKSVSEESDGDEDSMLQLEKEMWNTFYSTGFWRSPSQGQAAAAKIKEIGKSKDHV